jgi:exopolysaccharide biosynthesis polyprenyl glycosylphosphotransferase
MPVSDTDARSRAPRARSPASPRPREPDRYQYLALARTADLIAGVGALLTAFLIANMQRMPEGLDDFLGMRITLKNLVLVAGFAAVWRIACVCAGLYDWQRVRDRGAELRCVLGATTTAAALALIFPLISKTGAFSVMAVVYFGVGAPVLILALRSIIRLATTPRANDIRDIVIVGSGPRALKLYHDLCLQNGGYRVLGFVDSYDGGAEETAGHMLGTIEQLEGLLMHRAVDEVFIALPVRSCHREIQQVIQVCERVGVRSKYLSDIFESVSAKRRGEESGEFTFTAHVMAPEDHRMVFKRAIDVAGAGLALALVWPVMLISAAAIRLTSPGPVLFVQERYGFNRRRFRMFKFRTMVANAEAAQSTLEDRNEVGGPVFKIKEDPRITSVGKLLRRTSIDELPQLLNVLRGDMSLVGPRPLPVRDVHRFSEAALMRRFSMRPGITCLWQISGRSNIGFDEWIKLDLRYIDEWSLGLDFSILARTLPAVLKGDGAA